MYRVLTVREAVLYHFLLLLSRAQVRGLPCAALLMEPVVQSTNDDGDARFRTAGLSSELTVMAARPPRFLTIMAKLPADPRSVLQACCTPADIASAVRVCKAWNTDVLLLKALLLLANKKMQAQKPRLLKREVHEYALFCTACQAGWPSVLPSVVRQDFPPYGCQGAPNRSDLCGLLSVALLSRAPGAIGSGVPGYVAVT